jgi:hypothetical protein
MISFLPRRWPTLLGLTLLLSCAARGETALDLTGYQRQAGAIFNAQQIATPLSSACENLLLMMQAVSVTIVVAGMIAKLRKDHEQMEGIASLILKVAFIATIPFWKTFALETTDLAADTVGPPALQADGTSTPLMASMWQLAGQWMPASSPYLDALDSRSSTNTPASGEEQAWSMRAWNWARGITATTSSTFESLWHALSGSLRAFFVLLCCAAMTCLALIAVFAVYLAGILRLVLYEFGCALLPVFIAGLGLEALRTTSVQFILRLAAIACWPIGWAIANLVTAQLATGILGWMTKLTATAVGASPTAANLPSIADAAPFLAWGVLFLLVALTTLFCVWSLGSLLLGSITIGKAIGGGANFVSGLVGATSPSATSSTAPSTGALARLAGRTLSVPAAPARPSAPLPRSAPAQLRTIGPTISNTRVAPRDVTSARSWLPAARTQRMTRMMTRPSTGHDDR